MSSDGTAIDAPSHRFVPTLAGLGAWTDHLHFGYDAVATLRPRLLVELGTDRGESYFGFCQSAVENDTGTRCYAVDNWQGDLHVGGYDEATYREVAAHNEKHYRTFSTLVKSNFDEARARFEDRSIDLLHLDGLHTEDAVRQDLDLWLPKLRPGGILLMHDVIVRKRGFGVWKVWEELWARGRSFTFEVGPGLGLWEKPPGAVQPGLIEAFLSAPNERSTRLLGQYRKLSAEVHQRIAEDWRDGSIRDTYFAGQTTVQVFFSRDGAHNEEDSILARIGHDEPKALKFLLPPACQHAVRVDFVSAFTTIDIEVIRLSRPDGSIVFEAAAPAAFDQVRIDGDARRLPHPEHLRVEVSGIDPQLYLPRFDSDRSAEESVTLELKVLIHSAGKAVA